MEKDKNENNFLSYGSEWIEHEDHLVGNKNGLEKLQVAIKEAVETGESEIIYGDFLGVKCLDDEFFINKPEEPSNKLYNFIGFIIMLTLASMFIIGLVTSFRFIVDLL